MILSLYRGGVYLLLKGRERDEALLKDFAFACDAQKKDREREREKKKVARDERGG